VPALPREEFLRIARGDDPNRPPMWNGPPKITTPPQIPERPISGDGQLFDFLLPYPIHIFDDSVWPALHVRRPDEEILLLKPITQQVSPREEISKGNEAPDLFVTTFPAIVERTSRSYPLHHKTAFAVVSDAIKWIRVLTRQYWIGSGAAGVAAQYRGSVFRLEGADICQRNYAHYGQTTIIRSLKRSVWEALIYPVEQQRPIPVAHSLFCDALTSFAVGDEVLALVQLGVACEVAITSILDDLASAISGSPAAAEYLKARHEHRDNFGAKLLKHSIAFGLTDPKTFRPVSKPKEWVELLLTLYKFRNKAAHEGRPILKTSKGSLRQLKSGELQSFIFSVEAFFQWIREQRESKLGVPDIPVSVEGQVIATIGGINESSGFVVDTGESHGQDGKPA
jgi:hypothetical protein